jgi:hypothetical protein
MADQVELSRMTVSSTRALPHFSIVPIHGHSSGIQFAQSLNTVADSLRNCAHMAENYAAAVKHASLGPHVMMPANFGAIPQATPGGKRKAQALEDGQDGKKKRKPRAPRDPNAPKRPASSYLMFQNDIRAELKKKHPEVSNTELLAMISRQWQTMSEEQKSVSISIIVVPYIPQLFKSTVRFITRQLLTQRKNTLLTKLLMMLVIPTILHLPPRPPRLPLRYVL